MQGWETDKLKDNAAYALRKGGFGGGYDGIVEYVSLGNNEWAAQLVFRSPDADVAAAKAKWTAFATEILERPLQDYETQIAALPLPEKAVGGLGK